jgi:hypothetical protein
MISNTKPMETRIDPQSPSKPKNDFSKTNQMGQDVSAMKGPRLDSEGSEKLVEAVVRPNQSLTAQKPLLNVREDGKVPYEKPVVARRLFSEDEGGS